MFAEDVSMDVHPSTFPRDFLIEGGVGEFLDGTEVDEGGEDRFRRGFRVQEGFGRGVHERLASSSVEEVLQRGEL